jgi:transcriptional regulator
MKRNNKAQQDPTLKELDGIKRLLILFLIKAGASQGEIAMVLHTDQANVSRMFPARKVKRFSAEGN